MCSLDTDPKEYWAQHHPELFPVDINHADKMQLLRVPGLGEISVARIMETRKQYGAIHSVDTLKALGVRIHTAHRYIQMG